MKYTLLDLTQAVLSSMDSDEVNSISDSTESLQVATLIRGVYFDIIERASLPEHKTLFNLAASGDIDKPVLMSVPDTVSSVLWVKYNKASTENTQAQFRMIDFLDKEEFFARMHLLSTDDDNVSSFDHTVDGSTVTFYYKTDLAPACYTTFDDSTLIFDSYDNTVDATLQSSKTLGYGRTVIPFTMTDTFTPDLDEPQFALLLNESKAMAWAELKQTQHGKAEKNAKRQWTNLQVSKYRAEKDTAFDRLPNFGRNAGYIKINYGRNN